MERAKDEANNQVLETIITNVVKLPGIKVNRDQFLAEAFAKEDINMQTILDLGPVAAGVSKDHIEKAASKLILIRTSQSSIASFAAGIPGGLAMAATIPADIAQFFAMAMRLAQELAYLYGASDLWAENQIDDERIRNQLILYCGVMFGVSGAVSGVRVLSAQIAKTVLKKLPQKALTKTFWYPIIKQIGKAVGLKVTKTTVARGFSKAIPVVGGVISGSLNFASMMPMANRLNEALNQASFNYTEENMAADIEQLENLDAEDAETARPDKVSKFMNAAKASLQDGMEKASSGAASLLNRFNGKNPAKPAEPVQISNDEKIETVRKLKQLVDEGILSDDEFQAKKKEILELP